MILLCGMSFASSMTFAQVSVGISVGIAPPALPVYVQPECPADGYLWQPGYWAYDPTDGYYWVPGVWVAPPDPGLYWTPCYWGFAGGAYGFHQGYWGPSVGFYGGINYGFGYGGYGYGGGRWDGGHFRYNTAVVNVNRTVIHNTYVDRTVIHNTYGNSHTSFNGPGGITAKPRPEEMAAMKERHIQPTAQQMSHQQTASKNRSQFSSVNHGRPAAAAMNKVGGKKKKGPKRVYNAKGGHANNSKQAETTADTGHDTTNAKRRTTNGGRTYLHETCKAKKNTKPGGSAQKTGTQKTKGPPTCETGPQQTCPILQQERPGIQRGTPPPTTATRGGYNETCEGGPATTRAATKGCRTTRKTQVKFFN